MNDVTGLRITHFSAGLRGVQHIYLSVVLALNGVLERLLVI
jgi:hypothetical protein